MSKLDVEIWGKNVGVLEWLSDRDSAVFAYNKSFIDSGIELSPITMPLSDEVYHFPSLPRQTFKGLPGMVADSLPDRFGQALIETYFTSKGYTFEDLTSLDRLAYVGRRGMGAIEYQPSWAVENKKDKIGIDDLKSLARFGLKRATELQTQIAPGEVEGFQDILTIGTSAGGARAKAVIALNEKTGEIRSGQLDHGKEFENWIIKLDVAKESETLDKPQGYGRIEFTYYQIAREAKIRMNECRLMEDNGRGHFMTKRFDRENGMRHHMLTLTALRHIDYYDISSHSYNQLFETARYLGVPYKDMEQLYRQMVFNVVMVNCDDHTKNFAFMLREDDPTNWRVTPAYDMAYTYDPMNEWVSDHMRIQGKRRNITEQDLIMEGKKHGIKQTEKVIKEVLEASAKWQELAKSNGVDTNHIKAIQNRMNEVYSKLQVKSKERGMSM